MVSHLPIHSQGQSCRRLRCQHQRTRNTWASNRPLFTYPLLKVKSINKLMTHKNTPPSNRHNFDLTEEQRLAGIEKSRQAREKKKKWLESCTKTWEFLENRHPNHLPKINQLKNGSLSAAVKLACLDCSLGKIEEVRNCTAVACPLWPVRFWKKTGVTKDE